MCNCEPIQGESDKEVQIRMIIACVRKITTLNDLYKPETLWKMIAEEIYGYTQNKIKAAGLRKNCPHCEPVQGESWRK